jgi:hypothetical protein
MSTVTKALGSTFAGAAKPADDCAPEGAHVPARIRVDGYYKL